MADNAASITTPRYQQIVKAAHGIAHEMGHQHVGVEHLFLAIIRDEHAVPTQALSKIVDLHEAETRVLDIINSAAYHTSSSVPDA